MTLQNEHSIILNINGKPKELKHLLRVRRRPEWEIEEEIQFIMDDAEEEGEVEDPVQLRKDASLFVTSYDMWNYDHESPHGEGKTVDEAIKNFKDLAIGYSKECGYQDKLTTYEYWNQLIIEVYDSEEDWDKYIFHLMKEDGYNEEAISDHVGWKRTLRGVNCFPILYNGKWMFQSDCDELWLSLYEAGTGTGYGGEEWGIYLTDGLILLPDGETMDEDN